MSTQTAQTAVGRVWSVFQTAIFNFIADPNGGNAIVEAVAGSGKSTTIIAGMKKAKGSSVILVFNKSIADELKGKGVNARTFHSLVFGAVMQAKNQRNPDTNKLRDLCRSKLSFEENKLYGTFAQKMVGLARNMGIGCLLPDTVEEWVAIADHHDLEPEHEEADFGEGIEVSRRLLDLCINDPRVDFDDMLYFAVRDQIVLPKFDFVFLDEAQDTNPIQRAIVRKVMKPTSRLVAVGDPAQAIYGFRGASSDALEAIAREFKCITLPLSITYRCPTSVVSYAQQWVSHIQARDNAPEGKVTHLNTKWEPSIFQDQDLVVCRKTAPLITLAFKLIRANVPVMVMGREIGQGLKSLVKKMNALSIDQLQEKLEAFLEREVAKLREKEDEAKIEAITDKVDSLLYLIQGLKEGRRTIPDLEAGIDYLFANKDRAVIFATIHKSKGLEANRVFWLARSECPSKWARQDWQKQQEDNLCYVAATRAKEELFTMELAK